jgi:hypothetical protein
VGCTYIQRGFPTDILFTGRKQKQRVEQAESRVETSPPTPEPTNEVLASPVSASDFSPADSQQQEMHNFYDIASPETVPQQQSLPLSDDFIMPLQQLTPQLLPLQPLCSHTSTSGASLCLLHTGGEQQQQLTAHNFCNSHTPMTLQPHFQPLNHDYDMFPPQLAHQLSTSQPPCMCIPTSESASCHAQPGGVGKQQQRMHNCYYRVPLPYTSWAGSEDYARASCGQFHISCGPPSPAVDLNSPFVFPPLPSNPYMTFPRLRTSGQVPDGYLPYPPKWVGTGFTVHHGPFYM